MIKTVNLKNLDYAAVSGFIQWDKGQMLNIIGVDLPEGTEIHFSLQEAGGTAAVKEPVKVEDGYEVKIPQFIFEGDATEDYHAYAFIYQEEGDGGGTTHKIKMHITARPRPDDYVYGDDEILTWKQLDERITAIEETPSIIHTPPYYKEIESNTALQRYINILDLKPLVLYGIPQWEEEKNNSGMLSVLCEDGTYKPIHSWQAPDLLYVEKTNWNSETSQYDAIKVTIVNGLYVKNAVFVVDISDISTKNQVTVTKKLLANYLPVDNTNEYTPTEDYHPVTKKYVDDKKMDVDSSFDEESENPIQNKVITQKVRQITEDIEKIKEDVNDAEILLAAI